MRPPNAAPMPQRVLLFSGGLDSVCYAQVLRPDVLLHVPTGADYAKKERDVLERVASALPGELRVADSMLNLSSVTRTDAVVPARNAFLVLAASYHGDTIWLGRAGSDRQADSSDEFCNAMVVLLNRVWSEQFWCDGRWFSVSAPLSHMSKTALVQRFLAEGGKPETLLESVSCYDPEPGHCGICKPCMHKRVALALAGVKTPAGYWRHPWFRAPWTEWVAMGARNPALLFRG